MTTRIVIAPKDHVVMVSHPDGNGLVSADGADDYLCTKQFALNLAKNMRECYPEATYKVYQVTEVTE